MSMILENLVEMMSPIYFEIAVQFHERLPYSFLTQNFFSIEYFRKEVYKV